MTYRTLSALLFLACLTFSVNALDNVYVAMIADMEGQAEIKNVDSLEPADILIELSAGTQIDVKDGAKLTLFYFDSSEEYTYQGPAEILIEEQQPKVLAGTAADSRNLNMTKLADIAAEDEGSIDLGVLKLRNFEKPKLQLLEPVSTKVVSTHPRFSWLPVEGASSYEFILSNELGKRIADISVSENWVVLPDDTQLAAGQEYTWEIITQTSEQTEYRAHAYFTVAEKHISAQVDESRPNPTASFSEKVVYARILEKLGLKPAANAMWQELSTMKPDSALLQGRTAPFE